MTTLLPPDQNAFTFDLTIRFSASIADLLLSIPRSEHATTSTLKVEIRKHLPPDFSNRRIRLIHAGKALADDNVLEKILKVPSRAPTPRSSTPSQDPSSKGKAPVRDPPIASRIYVHCSIGDVVLSEADLIAEAVLGKKTPQPVALAAEDVPAPPLAPLQRGFDRLLNAGFTASEVQSLRLQFRAIQAHTHTPDTMPSPNTMRDMEEQWLDNSNNLEAGSSLAIDPEDAAGVLDDILYGATCGFFWPVGCVLWAGREEGIWSRRRKMSVVMGVVVNLAVGVLRWMR